MLLEILFLKGLWEHNRSLWRLSFPFHFGLYLLVGTGALLFLGALGELVGGLLVAPGTFLGGSLYFLTAVLGVLGAVLTILGGLGLLVRRLTDEDLKDYTSPSHIFNLLFIIAAAGSLLAAVILVDHDFALARDYVASLMGGHKAPPLLEETEALASPVMALEILLISLLIAYIPLTHMSHFFTKWFTWHKIRWDDEPNRVGSWIEKRIQEALNYPVSWSAEHIHADGKKTWADLATEEVQ
jgi:nitrate reductase gamma subunit